MQKKIIVLLSVLLALSSTAAVLAIKTRMDTDHERYTLYKSQASLEESVQMLTHQIDQIEIKRFAEFKFSQKTIDHLSLSSESAETTNLKDLSKSKIIFAYSTKNCNSCLNPEFGAIRRLIKKYGNDNILVINDLKTDRELGIVRKSQSLNCDFLRIVDGDLKIPSEHPFYFIYQPEQKVLKLNHVFVPDENSNSLSNNYLTYYNELIDLKK